MTCKVQNIVEMVETLAPPHLAEDWDPIGLQVGDFQAPVERVLIALDPSFEVMDHAAKEGFNLVLTHHPLIFRPLKEVHWNHSVGKLLQIALSRKINVFASHTNLDACRKGINVILSRLLDLKNPRPLNPHSDYPEEGFGRIGKLTQEISLTSFLDRVKKALQVETLRFIGNLHDSIRCVAVCGGSGASMIAMAREKGADCLVTADLKYHEALEAREVGFNLVDPGHFAMEVVVVSYLAEYLKGEIQKKDWKCYVEAFTGASDPFQFQ